MAYHRDKVLKGTRGTCRYVPVPGDWPVGQVVHIVPDTPVSIPEPEPQKLHVTDSRVLGMYYKVEDGMYEKVYSIEHTKDSWFIRTHNAGDERIFVGTAYGDAPKIEVYYFAPAHLRR